MTAARSYEFSLNEDARILSPAEYTLNLFNADGGAVADIADRISHITADGVYRIEAGALTAGNYTYNLTETNDEVVRVRRAGKIKIFAGGVDESPDEIMLRKLDEVLNGDDHDVLEIEFPDGRKYTYESRAAMWRRRNILQHRIAHGGSGLRGYSVV